MLIRVLQAICHARQIRGWRSVLYARPLVTLAIESSADDTSVAIVERQDILLSANGNSGKVTAAQIHFHKKVTSNNLAYKGIHPLVALDSHQQNLSRLVAEAVTELPKLKNGHKGLLSDAVSSARSKPDFVSVTRGPGMRSNLSTGLDTAKGLAVAWGVPLVGVNHMQAHALTPRLVSALSQVPGEEAFPQFPFLSLLVSGGHTMLINSKALNEHILVAPTCDIAIGDAIDKISRHILPADVLSSSASTMYGPLLEQFCFPDGEIHHRYQAPKNRSLQLERSLTPWGWKINTPFSQTRSGSKTNFMEYTFSGICSSVERISKLKSDKMPTEERRALAKEAMTVAFEHLASRIVLALNQESIREILKPTVAIVVSGGVAANKFLRTVLRAYLDSRGYSTVALIYPPLELCTDNAAMIGWTGIEMFRAGWQSDLGVQALRKWSLDPNAPDGGILGVAGWISSPKHDMKASR